MVAKLMFDGIAGRVGEQHLKSPAGVVAPPKRGIAGIDNRGIAGIDNLGVRGIECEGIDDAAEVDLVPGQPIVVRDVAARHVAVLHHNPGIVRADRWADRGAASTRTNYFPTA